MAGQYYKGTLLASPIVRGSSGDTYGTHHSVLGIGGYMEVNTVNELYRIPPYSGTTLLTDFQLNFDGISVGQRRLGMLVHVFENNNIYHLQPNISYASWLGMTEYNKIVALADNSNWNLFLTSGGTSGGGENISKKYIQVSHGFKIGDVLGYDGSEYTKVDTTTANTIEPLGIVSVSDYLTSNSGFTLTYAGYVDLTGIVDYSGGTLISGTTYYLAGSGVTSNPKLTKYQPTSLGEVSKPMLVSINANSGIVLQYRGTTKINEGVTLGDFYTYTGNTQIFLDKTVTGATNIGFFSGKTGVQTISILTSASPYNGNYQSLYNYYYRDSLGVIRIGTPTYHGILRRGYVSTFSPKKSWLYNVYTGSSNQVGWIFVDGDISVNVGNTLFAGNTSANAGTPAFTETEWSYTGGTLFDGYYSNTSISLDVNGDLHTGTTYNIGGPIYNNKVYQELQLRTIVTKNQSTIKVSYDDNFVYLSGVTLSGSSTGQTNATNIGTGVGVFDSKTGSTLQFRNLKASGGTLISHVGNDIVIFSSGGSGGEYYNLGSPAVCTIGGITAGTVLTGKTSFELFEEILVPVLYPTLTAPSSSILLSPSGTFEVGCTISTLCVTSVFDQGCINPQYTATCNKRSNGVTEYCFTGSQVVGSYACTTSPVIKCATSYAITLGSQSWGTCSNYCAGVQPKDSKGNNYNISLTSGTTLASTASLTGIYPYYYGKLTCCIRPAVTNSLISGGTKVLTSSTGTVSVTFNSSASDYTWLAIPSLSTSKTCWYVNALDNGKINNALSDKYPDECVLTISSGQLCWTGVIYKVYMSGTVGVISVPIEFRNN